MITNIIKTFRTQAREHKTIKSFLYSRNYEKGSGKDIYPLFWLEDPISGQNKDNVFRNSVNFSVLFTPDKKHTKEALQNLAFSIGLNIIERIKSNKRGDINIEPSWSYLTLTDYYDDNAIGCRFSLSFTQRNIQNLCLLEEQFDTGKEFEKKKGIEEFDVMPSNSCEVFTNKLPDFDIKINRK